MVDDTETLASADPAFGKLPDHLLIEIFIRVPISEWAQISCVKKQWANIFQEECLWQTALVKTWPFAVQGKRWPGPIPRGLSRRRYAALYVGKNILQFDDEIDEISGHSYLFLKEQLELSTVPLPGILHGTIIGLGSNLFYILCFRYAYLFPYEFYPLNVTLVLESSSILLGCCF
ncbi:uncharacterized protein LOC122663065 [Telopea speciosissima]|uniref:uncharacterized protein LOC122663065 n=1 Tax=Telopea speciosissima TaxID=54955 RepID=UPI001CC33E18|nr:uncharacterized protein LOC122663065 [Telopea speciosissima]